MSSFFSDWAIYAHKDDTGFGRMAADVRRVLGFGHHWVIPSERLSDHPVDGKSEQWLAGDASEAEVKRLLSQVKGVLFFERHAWHPHILKWTRELGVKTVCVPMWEWFKRDAVEWAYCDLFVCPTAFTEKIVRGCGYKNTIVLPWVLDLNQFPQRSIQGAGRIFVHNAGLVDRDDRKGTRDTIKAFGKVKRDDIRLIVRMQKEASLPPLDSRMEVKIGNLNSVSALYAEGDVCIQPSKMEGIGFMVLEPVCCGIPVITTDYPPMNEFVMQPEMRCAPQWFKRRAYATQWIKHAHLRLPNHNSLTACIHWAATHELGDIAKANREWAEQTFNPDVLKERWIQALLTS